MEKPHKKLVAYRESVQLVKWIYEIVEKFPCREAYGLRSQMTRAALSIPSNLAEGAARQTKKEFLQFLYIARGSLSELDTLLEISQDLGYLGKENIAPVMEKLERVDKMLAGLIRNLKGK